MQSLESVEEALVKLENLLQELHVSSSNSGKEDLKAACSDLEMIRRLKKEAEFLEASFRAKAEYLEVSLLAFFTFSISYPHMLLLRKANMHYYNYKSLVSLYWEEFFLWIPSALHLSWSVHQDTARREQLLRLL